MATGDVTVRLEGAVVPGHVSALPTLPLEQAEEARRQRVTAREAARQAEQPLPEPWDAWRNQKAPEMFEAEVTNRG